MRMFFYATRAKKNVYKGSKDIHLRVRRINTVD